jgi:TRAP-type transport system small permease protein
VAGAHLTIDILDKLAASPRMAWWRSVTAFAVAAVFALMAWLFVGHSMNAAAISEVSQALRIPRAPLYLFMAGSAALSAIAAIVIGISGPMVDPADKHKEEAL